jgi:hypothetical protein
VGGVGRRLLGLCLPPLALCALDGTLTLIGQSARYWAGDYARVNEGSPTFNHLLQIHPAAYVVGILVWAGVFVSILLLLPDTLALIVSIAVTLGHTVGAATWLLWRFHFGYQVCNGLFLTSAVILGLGIRWGWRAIPDREYRLQGWPWGLRWLLALVLFGVGVYLFLWPRMP